MLTPTQTRTTVMDSSDTKNRERTVIVRTELSAAAYDSSPDQLARTEQMPAETAFQTYPNWPVESDWVVASSDHGRPLTLIKIVTFTLGITGESCPEKVTVPPCMRKLVELSKDNMEG
jgi:hypothetical protein